MISNRSLKIVLLLFFCSGHFWLWAQKEKAFVWQFENDAFFETDRYYTNGLLLSFHSPVLDKNPLNRILMGSNLDFLSGLSIVHSIYTPISKESDTAVIGDRPFSGVFILRSEKMSQYQNKRLRIVSGIDVGLTGKAALGDEVQNAIHALLPTSDPVDGWSYVQPTSIALNYDVALKYACILSPFFELNALFVGALGTVRSFGNMGIEMRVGKLIPWNTYFFSPQKDWQVYLLGGFSADLVIYDATLQGGPFTEGSANKIPYDEMNRILPRYSYGLGIQFKKITLDLVVKQIGPEFTSSLDQTYGSIRFNYNFN